MPTVKTSSVELYYEAYGAGTPVIFMAGYGGVGAYWKPQVEAFSRHFRPILLDHRGHGKSTHDTSIRYSIDQMADDVVAVMDGLGIKKAHYVGHSLGGVIGQNLGVRYADRFYDLVIFASFARFDPWIARCIELRRTLLKAAGPRAFVRATPIFLYPHWWFNGNTDALAALEEATMSEFPPEYVVESRSEAVAKFDMRAELKRISLPTLLLGVRDDFLTPPHCTEEIARYLPHAKVVWLERGGHAGSQTSAAEFNKIVVEFLKAHEPDGHN